jgi:hypothetical protein
MNRYDRLCELLATVTPPILTPGQRERIERERYTDIERLTLAVEEPIAVAARGEA